MINLATLALVWNHEVSPKQIVQPLSVLDLVEINCIAHAVYHEARGEKELGQIAVAHVVLNRTRHPKHPESACDVVYEPRQFTNIKRTDPDLASPAWQKALQVAQAAYLGRSYDPTQGAKFFYASDKVQHKSWASNKVNSTVIGGHKFFDLPN